jgi:anti-sigma factor RsiW
MNVMNCTQCRELIPTYLDSELDAARVPALERHLADCDGCAEQLQAQRELAAALRGNGVYRRAPERLRQRVQEVMKRESPAAGVGQTKEVRRRWGLSLVAGVVLAIVVDAGLIAAQRQYALSDEIVAAHVRSLMADHLMDLASEDPQAGQSWFAGKLDFSPPVYDFGATGFMLAGGRLDYVDHHPAAVLIYKHRQHVINLFVWPASNDTLQHARAHNGYNLVHWTSNGMNHWAVSDLGLTELGYFSDQVRGAEQSLQ